MKIFKNRGDIYISKSKYKSSKEERVLLLLLVVIIIITVAFVILLGNKYSHVSDFFADGEVTATQAEDSDELVLPAISGKTNFLLIETDDSKEKIHYLYLIQADKDNVAYKVSALSPETKLDDESVCDAFNRGGGAELQKKLTEFFGFEIDYFAQFSEADFVEFVDELGNFIYPLYESIRYDGGSDEDTYVVHLSEGEVNMSAKNFSNLMRYYSNDNVNFAGSNELMLYALTSLFNADNYDDAEALFRLFIKNSSTNITVRDFEKGKDALMVFCYRNADLTIYSAVAEYDKNTLTNESVSNIKGYFAK